jgi:hypothetical protein
VPITAIEQLQKEYRDRTIEVHGFKKLMSIRHEVQGIYNWFPFFQAFTSILLKNILSRPEINSCKRILDPFAGSGNTLLACKELGRIGFGLEVNPLFRFIAKTKTGDYTTYDFANAEKIVTGRIDETKIELPVLSSFSRCFEPEIMKRLLAIRSGKIAYSAWRCYCFRV